MKMNKYVFGVLAAFLLSPVLFEMPGLWRWAEVQASEHFLKDARVTTNQNTGIQIWGRERCVYTKKLREALDQWQFNYVYYDIDFGGRSEISAMYEVVKRAHPTERWSLPVVDVNGKAIVGDGTNIDSVANALVEQGKLPLKYAAMRAGLRMILILILPIALVCSVSVTYIVFALLGRAMSSKRTS